MLYYLFCLHWIQNAVRVYSDESNGLSVSLKSICIEYFFSVSYRSLYFLQNATASQQDYQEYVIRQVCYVTKMFLVLYLPPIQNFESQKSRWWNFVNTLKCYTFIAHHSNSGKPLYLSLPQPAAVFFVGRMLRAGVQYPESRFAF